jgi:hypothetical protein
MRLSSEDKRLDDCSYLREFANILEDPTYRVKLKTKYKPEMVQISPLMAEQVALRLREIADKVSVS